MNTKPSVCHLSSVHVALDTRIFYRFCQSQKLDYDVTLIAVHPVAEVRQGIRIIPFRRFRNKLLRVCITWLVMYFKAMKTGASLFQLHDPELIPCGLLLRLSGKKVVLDIHENVAEDIFDKPWIPSKKLLFAFFGFFEKLAVQHMQLFLAENSYEDRYKKLGARYEIVLNYHDPEFFMPYCITHRPAGNHLFYIGILLESRGILQVAEAMYLLQKKGMVTEFDVVGELYSDLAGKLQALPFYRAVAPHIHFHGRLPLEEGYAISRQASVGMCIIHPMKNSVGSYPTKMFEYMAIGLPQVISDFPLYKSVVETHHCGICADPMNPEQIANAIETLLSNRELSMNMGNAGIEASSAYTWDREYQKADQVYRRLLGLA